MGSSLGDKEETMKWVFEVFCKCGQKRMGFASESAKVTRERINGTIDDLETLCDVQTNCAANDSRILVRPEETSKENQ